jgi:predicted dehydrogenase
MSDLRVGLLAYGAIGHEHNLAVQATPGLALAAVCDTNPDRLTAALELAPEAVTFTDATQMLDSGLLDIVVVSTPPNSHAHWARQALERGIHVVLEKPMALTADECDELIALAAEQDLLLIVYQNRRYDRDFVTLARLVDEGILGEVFQYDCFVGGYSQPCTYWHSDVAVSGGAIFDWGSHFLDQMLTVMPGDIDFVTAINHKRHWHHVTNADHAQVTVTFTDGRQSTFVNSDLAAARRPKFYVLGTLGAIVGDWDPAAEPAVADLPAILTLHRPDGTREQIPLDEVADFAFHASLAQRLHDGVGMAVRTEHSRDVVSIMEAAEQSAVQNGRPVTPSLLRS